MKVPIGSLAESQLALEKAQEERIFPSFLDAFMAYTSNLESTDKFRRWTGISVMAAALERKVWLDMGHFKIVPNLYVFLIGESGSGKSVTVNVGANLAKEIDSIRFMSEQVTQASLIEQLHRSDKVIEVGGKKIRHSSVFCFADELIVFLREVSGTTAELLTTFYDYHEKPWTKETKTQGETKIFGPCLNFLGASTPTWLSRAIPIEEAEGGFSSRVLFVVETDHADRLNPWPVLSEDDERTKRKLVEDLRKIHGLQGRFEVSDEARETYAGWYKNYRRNTKTTDSRFVGYFSRKPTSVLKVSMILSASEGNDLIIEASHVEKAISFIDDLETTLFEAFGRTGKNAFAKEMSEIRDLLVVRKKVSLQELLQRYYKDLSGNNIMTIMSDLDRMGISRMIQSGGKTFYQLKDSAGGS